MVAGRDALRFATFVDPQRLGAFLPPCTNGDALSLWQPQRAMETAARINRIMPVLLPNAPSNGCAAAEQAPHRTARSGR